MCYKSNNNIVKLKFYYSILQIHFDFTIHKRDSDSDKVQGIHSSGF